MMQMHQPSIGQVRHTFRGGQLPSRLTPMPLEQRGKTLRLASQAAEPMLGTPICSATSAEPLSRLFASNYRHICCNGHIPKSLSSALYPTQCRALRKTTSVECDREQRLCHIGPSYDLEMAGSDLPMPLRRLTAALPERADPSRGTDKGSGG